VETGIRAIYRSMAQTRMDAYNLQLHKHGKTGTKLSDEELTIATSIVNLNNSPMLITMIVASRRTRWKSSCGKSQRATKHKRDALYQRNHNPFGQKDWSIAIVRNPATRNAIRKRSEALNIQKRGRLPSTIYLHFSALGDDWHDWRGHIYT